MLKTNRPKLLLVAAVIVCLTNAGISTNVTESKEEEDYCPDIRDANLKDGGPEYCNCTYKQFRRRYHNANLRLTSFLEKLRYWNCPQFQDECENRYFVFNRYTSLVYDRFCNLTVYDRFGNLTNFTQQCRKEIESLRIEYEVSEQRRGNRSFEEFSYGKILFSSPCLQVSAYQYNKSYYEIARPFFAFCDSVWCGFNDSTLKYHSPSTWLCLPTSCRVNIIITMVVCGVLAVAVVMANLTVIIVMLRNPKFPTSQLIYKVSLAFADLLVGLFVLPSAISTLYLLHVGPYHVRRDAEEEATESNAFNANVNIDYVSSVPLAYRNFFGFVTFMSMLVSVFTLTFAAYDRHNAISSPLRYDKSRAYRIAKWSSIAVWCLSFILGILPIVVPGLKSYRITSGGVLSTVFDEVGVFMQGIPLGVCFFVMWGLTISVQVRVSRQLKERKSMVSRRQHKHSNTERRLTKTLSIMIGVFTACILPAIIFTIVPEFVHSINPQYIKKLAKKPASAFISLELAVVIILLSNSLWNAFIYSIRNKEFRKDAFSMHCAIASALGLVWLKRQITTCVYKTAYDGRRRISSAFTATSYYRKKSSTTSNEIVSAIGGSATELSSKEDISKSSVRRMDSSTLIP